MEKFYASGTLQDPSRTLFLVHEASCDLRLRKKLLVVTVFAIDSVHVCFSRRMLCMFWNIITKCCLYLSLVQDAVYVPKNCFDTPSVPCVFYQILSVHCPLYRMLPGNSLLFLITSDH